MTVKCDGMSHGATQDHKRQQKESSANLKNWNSPSFRFLSPKSPHPRTRLPDHTNKYSVF